MHGAPHGQLPAHDSLASFSIADQLAGLLANPNLARSWLFDAFPRDPSTLTIPPTTIRVSLSTDGHQRYPTDLEERQFSQAIVSPLSFISSLQGQLFGAAMLDQGEIVIGDAALTHRDLAGLDWNSREASIFLGPHRGTQVQFAEVGIVKTRGRRYNRQTITIMIDDYSFVFDRPLQTNFFAGTGGLDGTSELTDRARPILIGQVDQLEPIAVDPVSFIYQIHDGSIGAMQSIDYVKDKMIDFVFDEDVADITTATPGVGEFATSLATGHFRLQALPSGVLTCGAKGLVSTTFGYANTIATILKVLAVDFTGELDADANLDPLAFNALESHDAIMGWYFREPSSRERTLSSSSPRRQRARENLEDSGVTIRDAMQIFHRSAMSFSRLLPNKVLTVGRITDPDFASVDFTLDATKDAVKLTPWEWRPFELPVGRVLVGYRRYQRTLSASDVDASIDADELEDIAQEFRFAKDELDGPSLAQNDDHKTVNIMTALYNKADADALAVEQLAMRDTKRDLGRISSATGLLTHSIGEVVRLIDERLGVTPKRYVVLGVRNVAAALGRDDKVELELYG